MIKCVCVCIYSIYIWKLVIIDWLAKTFIFIIIESLNSKYADLLMEPFDWVGNS